MTTEDKWSEKEFEEINLGDERLNRRIIKLAEELSKQPQAFINQASEDWADAKAAYRFFDNEKVSAEKIMIAHQSRVQQRMKEYKRVLAIQDTTEIDYTTHRKVTGLGQIGNEKGKGLMMHTSLIVTTQGLPLGLLAQEIWGRKKQKSKKSHKKQSYKDKESYKWITALEQTIENTPAATQVITICDREADIYEFLLRAEQLNASYVVRASWDRNLLMPEEINLWEALENTPIIGELEVEVGEKKSVKKQEPARVAKVGVRVSEVELKPPQRLKAIRMEGWKAIAGYAVYVKEINPPQGVTPLEWMLLTNVEVNNFEDAIERIQWYSKRWSIEIYHKVLKSGCRVEDCLLETAERLKRYLALMCVIAWRLFWLTHINRQNPQAPCTSILAESEWQALYCRINKTSQLPIEPPTVGQAVRWIAQLGGFLARKGDGEPGITVIWRGWHRLTDIVSTWLIFHPL